MLDLLIQNGLVADGAGAPAREADVAVRDGMIVAVEPHITEAAQRVIDAKGRVVSPGFIDYHSHSDNVVLFGTDGYNYIEQGVTTEITGHCGTSPAPAYPNQFDNESRPVAGTSRTPYEVCDSFHSFMDHVEHMALPTNMAFYAGQGNIRGRVIGFSDRKATPDELEQMRAWVRQAMDCGFLGISTGLVYPPSFCADEDELVELAREVTPYGGTYVSHIRGERNTVLDAVGEAISIGERAGCGVVISHHKIGGKVNRGKSQTTLKMIEDANARGVRVRADQYPYIASSTSLIATMPNQFTTDGLPALVQRLKDPAFRAQVTAILNAPGADNTLTASGFDGCLVLSAPATPDCVGKNIAEIAAIRGTDPFETVYDLLVENSGDVGMAYFYINQEDMERIITHPLVMAGTDWSHNARRVDPEQVGGGHPRGTGTFPRHLKLVRERRIMPMEQAIARITALPADTAGLPGIGMLKPGYAADICVFDWENLSDHADFLHPFRRNTGIEYVIINGQVAAEGGQATGVKAGRVHKLARRK